MLGIGQTSPPEAALAIRPRAKVSLAAMTLDE